MTDHLENLSREELIELIKSQEAQTDIHPNSLASVLMMDGKEAPKHYVKNVMHPAAKVMFVVISLFLLMVFGTLFIAFLFL